MKYGKTVGLVNQKLLREKLKAQGLTVTALAGIFGCARPVIYYAMERPSRYPIVYSKLKEFCAAH